MVGGRTRRWVWSSVTETNAYQREGRGGNREGRVEKGRRDLQGCGGADKACGGAVDLAPVAIGFAPTCPAVDPPDGAPSCFNPIVSLQDVVTCIDCVTNFRVDCSTLAAVPGFTPYPPECAP